MAFMQTFKPVMACCAGLCIRRPDMVLVTCITGTVRRIESLGLIVMAGRAGFTIGGKLVLRVAQHAVLFQLKFRLVEDLGMTDATALLLGEEVRVVAQLMAIGAVLVFRRGELLKH